MKTLLAFGLFIIMTTAASAAEPKVHRSKNEESAKMTAADHSRIAVHYRAEADKNNAQGAAYEQAAAKYRSGPFVKNLISPTTPGRYEHIAKTYREKATADRERASSHENMARLSTGL